MVNIESFFMFISALLINFIPGACIIFALGKKRSIIEFSLLSILISFSLNSIIMHILKYLGLKINFLSPLSYLIITSLIFLILSKKKTVNIITKEEKRFIFLAAIYLLIFSSFLFFGYLGNEAGDILQHINRLSDTVEEGALPSNLHHFFVDSKEIYPMGFNSLVAMPAILFKQTDGIILAQYLWLFSRIIPLIMALIIYQLALIFLKNSRAALLSSTLYLLAGITTLLPIYWGGLATNFTLLYSMATFLILFSAIIRTENTLLGVVISSLLTATAFATRLDFIIYFPITIISLFLIPFININDNLNSLKKRTIKILFYYCILTTILVFVLYLPTLINYYHFYVQDASIHEATAEIDPTPLFDWRRLIPALPFIFLLYPSLLDKKLRPLLLFGAIYLIGVTLLIYSQISFISNHIVYSFIIPFSVICGQTIHTIYKKNKRIIFYFYIILVLLFLLVNLRQHYITPFSIQEKELKPILWIKEQLPQDSRFFYQTPYVTSWIRSVAKMPALSFHSMNSPQTQQVIQDFEDANKELNQKNMKLFKQFLEKYKITHIILTNQEYSVIKDSLGYKVLYEDERFKILEIK